MLYKFIILSTKELIRHIVFKRRVFLTKNSHSQTPTLTQTQTHTHTHTHTRTPRHTHTDTHSLIHTQTHFFRELSEVFFDSELPWLIGESKCIMTELFQRCNTREGEPNFFFISLLIYHRYKGMVGYPLKFSRNKDIRRVLQKKMYEFSLLRNACYMT